MQSGIIRRIDDLGRIVIPKDVRRYAGFDEDTPVEIMYDADDNGFPVVKLRRYGAQASLRMEAAIKEAVNDLREQVSSTASVKVGFYNASKFDAYVGDPPTEDIDVSMAITGFPVACVYEKQVTQLVDANEGMSVALYALSCEGDVFGILYAFGPKEEVEPVWKSIQMVGKLLQVIV